ncbi:hypothetical protein VNO78_14988 [Psophocarpus tetragonolobus]|uniref:Uncharacterized protein n=1 Tax=Psophocarpus tetragonolobus TaxID=3891 RepID=A0AAN9SE86_PSOTE
MSRLSPTFADYPLFSYKCNFILLMYECHVMTVLPSGCLCTSISQCFGIGNGLSGEKGVSELPDLGGEELVFV